MERAIAVKTLAKLLGKSFGYQIDSKAPSPEERSAARAELPAAVKTRQELADKMTKRKDQLLAADPVYQAILAGYQIARKRADQLSGMSHRYKFCVGTSNKLFFHVAAQGDSWEDVIKEVRRKHEAKQLFTA